MPLTTHLAQEALDRLEAFAAAANDHMVAEMRICDATWTGRDLEAKQAARDKARDTKHAAFREALNAIYNLRDAGRHQGAA